MPNFWIEHPACQDGPVGFLRWVKWHLSLWFADRANKLERDALYPNCKDCGRPRNRGNHSKCFEIPF